MSAWPTFERQNSELTNLTGCELIQSQFALQGDYPRALALDYFTEVTDQLLPPHELNEKFFRLLAAALEHLRGEGDVWSAVLYFSLWAVRLAGVFPEMRVSHESREIAEEMFVTPLKSLAPRTWNKSTAADLRRQSGPRHGASRRTQIPHRAVTGGSLTAFAPGPFAMDSYQETVLKLKHYWADRALIMQEPYDVEVGAGTMCPETFLRVLGPKPYRVAYVQPSRRPADGRYGENPNRLYKHQQLQLILKPTPDDVIDQYLGSLEAIGIDLSKHDLKLEEDNWESPTLGAWGIGWQVMLDGLEISQFTYFQQCGGMDLELVPAEITYGLERIRRFCKASRACTTWIGRRA